jgi:hypothetical protein
MNWMTTSRRAEERSTGIMRRWGQRRFALAVAGVLVASTLSMVPLVTPAGAAVGATVTCVGSSLISYSPGLTLQTTSVSYTERDVFGACGSTDPKLTFGLSIADGDGPASCLYLPVVFPDRGYTISWDNGRTSTLSIVYTDTIVGGTENVNAVGHVVAGEFVGATAVIVWAYPVANVLQCIGRPGVTNESGPMVLQITSL